MTEQEEEMAKTTATVADEDNKSAVDTGIGIMEQATTSAKTLGCQVARIRRAKNTASSSSSFAFPAKFDKKKVSMGRKIVKKAIKTRQKMENNRNSQNRGFDLLQQLCKQQSKDGKDDNKNVVEFEEPPPRPPTRRCMFYRDDPEPKAVLRVKQC